MTGSRRSIVWLSRLETLDPPPSPSFAPPYARADHPTPLFEPPVLAGAIDASFKDSSKDTLYLKRVHRPPSSMPTQFLSMSFQDEDKIWLIDAPRAVIESVEEAVGYSWSKGISKSGPLRKDEGCWEITVRGSPCGFSSPLTLTFAVRERLTTLDCPSSSRRGLAQLFVPDRLTSPPPPPPARSL